MKIRVGNEMMEAEDVINAHAALPLIKLEVYKAKVDLYSMITDYYDTTRVISLAPAVPPALYGFV